MKILVDTHVLLWGLTDDARLSQRAREILLNGDNHLLWSLASSWEVAVKTSIGKLQADRPLHRLFAEIVRDFQLELVPINHDHCSLLVDLPLHHRDPFDRMLIVQAQQAKVPLLSADKKLSVYDLVVVW